MSQHQVESSWTAISFPVDLTFDRSTMECVCVCVSMVTCLSLSFSAFLHQNGPFCVSTPLSLFMDFNISMAWASYEMMSPLISREVANLRHYLRKYGDTTVIRQQTSWETVLTWVVSNNGQHSLRQPICHFVLLPSLRCQDEHWLQRCRYTGQLVTSRCCLHNRSKKLLVCLPHRIHICSIYLSLPQMVITLETPAARIRAAIPQHKKIYNVQRKKPMTRLGSVYSKNSILLSAIYLR